MNINWNSESVNFGILEGKTCTSVTVDGNKSQITFVTNDGTYVMGHQQDCCESVYVEDINGDLNELVGTPIVSATESSNQDNPKYIAEGYPDESHTWTFYRISTTKGTVVIRWYGSSNGYYSESVQLYKA